MNHKVRIYKEYHSVCPLVGIVTLPTPLSPASVPLPRRWGAHSPAGEGLGKPQFRRLEKKLSTLPTLWNEQSSFMDLPNVLTILYMYIVQVSYQHYEKIT